MEHLWETWTFGCPLYSPTHHDLHNQLEIMFEPFWGWGGASTCCVHQVLLRHSPLAQSENSFRGPCLSPFGSSHFCFQLLVRVCSHKHSAAAVGLFPWQGLGSSASARLRAPLWKLGKNINLSGRSGVNVQNDCMSSLMDLPLQNE